MYSINALKGYGKVDDQKIQIQSSKPNPDHKKSQIKITIAVSSTIFLTITLIGLIAAAIFRESREPPESSESLKMVCAVTQHPDTCFTALLAALTNSGSYPDPINRLDPKSIFKISLQVSSKEVSNLSYSFRSINDTPKEDTAVNDCVSLLNDALGQLDESASAILTTDEKMGDVRTWISAAMTDLETCSDGLNEMGSVVGEEIKGQLQRSKEMTSNSLAIASSMNKLQQTFHSTMA